MRRIYIKKDLMHIILWCALLPLFRTKNAFAAEVNRYKALAMDESMKNPSESLVRTNEIYGPSKLERDVRISDDKFRSDDVVSDNSLADVLNQREDISDQISTLEMPTERRSLWSTYDDLDKTPGLIDVDTASNKSLSDVLISMPKKETKVLTQLITSNNKNGPTFVQKEPVRASTTRNGKVLASYRVIIPIWIPAYKNRNGTRTQRLMPDVKYVKETRTEMIPVKKEVAKMNTVIKAEPVPQMVVTDYVKSHGDVVPPVVNDEVKPNEELIDTVVTKYS